LEGGAGSEPGPGRQFHFPPPVCEINRFSSWSKMLGSIRGHPVALKLPIQKATVRWLLAWRPSTLAAHRARLLTVVATLGSLQRGRAAAGVLPVVRLSDIVPGARL
jgi:hypothetical protein